MYQVLDVFGDVPDRMKRLRNVGYDLYVVPNGNPEMLASMVDHAEIGDLIKGTAGADGIATFKPAADLYRHAAAGTDTSIDEFAHVSAG